MSDTIDLLTYITSNKTLQAVSNTTGLRNRSVIFTCLKLFAKPTKHSFFCNTAFSYAEAEKLS